MNVFGLLRNQVLHSDHLWGREDAIQVIYNHICAPLLHESAASLLIVGTAGSGKSECLQRALTRVIATYKDCKIVRLSGSLHTSEALATNEILRQLGQPVQPSDAMLLDEDVVLTRDQVTGLQSLNAVLRQVRGVVFVLDQYELFAQRTRQTVLYSLYDASHVENARQCVVGMTSRFDCIEWLEKRIKSRARMQMVEIEDYSVAQLTQIVDSVLKLEGAEQWNEAIDFLLAAPRVQAALRTLHVSMDVRLYQQFLLNVLMAAEVRDADNPELAYADFEHALADLLCGPFERAFDALSLLEKALLRIITYDASRCEDSFLPPDYTFVRVMASFRKLLLDDPNWRVVRCSESAALVAFRDLIDSRILMLSESRSAVQDRIPISQRSVQLRLTANELEQMFTDKSKKLPTMLSRPGSFYT